MFPSIDTLSSIWRIALDNLEALSDTYCTPLYLSQQEEENFMTLIYDVKEADHLAGMVVKNIPPLLHPHKTRTLPLLMPVFFPAPKDRPENLERYQVAVRGGGGELEGIFNHILHLDYPKDAFPTYAAYSFGEDDILVSMLSTSRDRLREFVKANLEARRGVNSVGIGHINRSKRVAPTEMWKRYRESRYLSRPTAQQEEYDFLQGDVLRGAADAPV